MVILVLSGKTAAGKSTIFRKLSEEINFALPRRFTTRPQRPNEDDQEYDFISEDTFSRYESAGIVSAVRETGNGWFYGIDNRTISEDLPNLVITDPVGLLDLEVKYPGEILSVFLDVPYKSREMRLFARGDDKIEMERRLLADEHDFSSDRFNPDRIIDGRKPIPEIIEEVKQLLIKF